MTQEMKPNVEMVLESFQRYDGDERCFIREETYDAVHVLLAIIEYEIGFGADFIEIGEHKLVLETPILGMRDITTYQPVDASNMPIFKRFYECAVIANLHRLKQMEKGTPQHKQMIDTVMKFSDGNPRLIAMGAPMLMGQGIARKLFAYFACFDDTELLEQLLKMPTKDLKAIASGVLKGEFSKKDVLILSTSVEDQKAA